MKRSLVAKFFNALGYEVYRKSNPISFMGINHDQALLVEFVGASAVGKTVIYNQLLKNHREWLTMSEFLKIETLQNNYTILDDLEIYQKLAYHRLKAITNRNNLFTDKFKNAHWNYQKLWEDAIVYKKNKNIQLITDEGLLHNYRLAIIDLATTDKESIQDLLKNRIVIYCYASPEKIVQRIKKRELKIGRIQASHRNKTDEELKTLIEKEISEYESYLAVLEYFKIPIIRIDTQKDLNLNILNINQFVKAVKNDT